MTRRRHGLALWLVVLSLVARAATAGAQTVGVFLSNIVGDSTSPAPAMNIVASGLDAFTGPFTYTIELSLESAFRTPFYVNAADNQTTIFHIDTLLTEHELVFFRSRVLDARGSVVAQSVVSFGVHSWLRLVDPASAVGSPLTTRKPRFIWSSPPITSPPGPWVYNVAVINRATGQVDQTVSGISDTSFVFPDSLQSNTSYSWQVQARAVNGPASDQVTVSSPGTFVITSSDQPTFTLFYQNFPNPFGRNTRSATTCFWFDLAHQANVSLVIYDIRLRKVRSIIPGPIGSGSLPVGAYGRQNVSTQTGCDDRLSWDGKDDTGRFVPLGVYIAVFNGDGVRQSVKILYKGP